MDTILLLIQVLLVACGALGGLVASRYLVRHRTMKERLTWVKGRIAEIDARIAEIRDDEDANALFE